MGGTCLQIQLPLHHISNIFVTLSPPEGKYTHLIYALVFKATHKAKFTYPTSTIYTAKTTWL